MALPSVPRTWKRQLQVSLDVITDGSEHTGHGTIFLTIAKSPRQEPDCVLARYAIAGLSSMTARLCADQKVSVRHVRAVTCPTHSCGAGLASLLLNLSQAGAASLAVCGGPGVASFAETVASMILRNRAYPKVSTCEVPLVDSRVEQQQWWEIYSDEYVIVHGALVVGNDVNDGDGMDLDNNGSAAIFLYTIIDAFGKSLHSFCVMPPGHSTATSVLHPLPQLVDEQKTPPLDFIICLDPVCGLHCDVSSLFVLSTHVLCTIPSHNMDWDDGLLIRAAFQAGRLHRAMPLYFPMTDPDVHFEEDKQRSCDSPSVSFLTQQTAPGGNTIRVYRLESCTSWVLQSTVTEDASDNPFQLLMRKTQIWKRCQQQQLLQTVRSNPIHGGAGRAGHECQRETMRTDDNEIDLDESDEDSRYDGKSIESWQRRKETIFQASKGECPGLNGDSVVVADDNEIDLSGENEDESKQGELASEKPAQHSEFSSKQLDNNCLTRRNDRRTPSWGPSTPQLLVLGTGCASPSPLRGSSGYALFLPTMKQQVTKSAESGRLKNDPDLSLSAVIECGEGFLTCLSRHLPLFANSHSKDRVRLFNEKLLQIRLIWISHAHLDHYGGLPCLIRAIHKAGRAHCSCGEAYVRKRKLGHDGMSATCSCSSPPVVVAPTKVLQFLDASLRCVNGKSPVRVTDVGTGIPTQNFMRLFFGVNHREFQSSPFANNVREMIFNHTLLRPRDRQSTSSCGEFDIGETQKYRPFSLLTSVPVEHCPQAHALLLGLNLQCDKQRDGVATCCATNYADNSPAIIHKGGTQSSYVLCFSGDTLPSRALVRACRDVCFGNGQKVSLLLHESTFSDDERGVKEAREKRHSTVLQALDISRQIQAEACILTHFSQRYPYLPPGMMIPAASESAVAQRSDLVGRQPNYAFATDGLLLPLPPIGLASLYEMTASELQSTISSTRDDSTTEASPSS